MARYTVIRIELLKVRFSHVGHSRIRLVRMHCLGNSVV